jgi:pyruvate kinase
MPTPSTTSFDPGECAQLIHELLTLRQALLDHETDLATWIGHAGHAHEASARNLAHFLVLREHDLRSLQQRLASLGLSSLGRAETHVLANLDKVLVVLHRLAGLHWTPRQRDEPVGRSEGQALLCRHANDLFGPVPALRGTGNTRGTRIMVTLPTEAAHDPGLTQALVAAGMDLARINCAHDDAAHWQAMALNVRAAAQAAGRTVKVLMDLGGPKLRTGPIGRGAAVLKIKPTRDAYGRLETPARLAMRAASGPPRHERRTSPPTSPLTANVGGVISVDESWLAALQVGDRLDTVDARGAQRSLRLVQRLADGSVVAECRHTVYLSTETRLHRRLGTKRSQGDGPATGVHDLPTIRPHLLLHQGDRLRLRPDGIGRGATDTTLATARQEGKGGRPAQISCSLPEALDAVRVGDRLWFDDGRIGAVVRRRVGHGAELEITSAQPAGERLMADKGINLPDTALDLPALTNKDMADLAIVARCADLVGLSFAQSASDVKALRAGLAAHGGAGLGLLLKIETRRGFEHLPEMLMAAMAAPAAGVMIARGDLAVECGFGRLAEVQEEILWACEAAHLPVVWATQVLETLAQTGRPSRAEITDAAMGVRAECVMLNKGPHVLQAVHMLDDILCRMQTHQSKKRPQMRALKAWHSAGQALPAAEKRAGLMPGA